LAWGWVEYELFEISEELLYRPVRRIRCLNLPGQQRLLVFEFGVLHLFIEVGHLSDEFDHAVVPGLVGGVEEVDGADGESRDNYPLSDTSPAGSGRMHNFFWWASRMTPSIFREISAV